jgi:cardiolipin synthase A/B
VQLDAFIRWGIGIGLMILLLLLILYLRGTFRDPIQYRMKGFADQMKSFLDLEDPHLALLSGLSNSLVTHGHLTGFWSRPEEIYAARLAAVRRARELIYFETFFMTPGYRPQELAAALIERAQSGVKVQFLADSFGALSLPQGYWKQLEAAGVEVRFYERFKWKRPLDYLSRTHRKLLIIDRQVVLTGGTGVSDHWDGTPKAGDTAPWLDTEVRFEGPIVRTLEGIFLQHWLEAGGVGELYPKPLEPSQAGGSMILVTPSDSPRHNSSICTLFYTSILAARERVWIASPYFLPEINSRRALIQAHRQGIDVRILTVGPHNDKKWVYYAVRERYEDLLQAGIPIYEYQPSMMHAKLFLIDTHWVITGSANFDPRSLFHNDELNFSMSDSQFAATVESFFHDGFARSQHIKLSEWRHRPRWQRLTSQLPLFFQWQL